MKAVTVAALLASMAVTTIAQAINGKIIFAV